MAKAIDITKRLSRKRQQVLKPLTAHFYCQLADEASDDAQKIKLLQQALKQDPQCGRALLTLAKKFLDIQDYAQCKQMLLQLKNRYRAFADAIPRPNKFIATQDKEGFQELLAGAMADGAGASVVVALAQHMISLDEIKAAETMVLDALYRHPTMKGFQHLMQNAFASSRGRQAKQSLTMLEQLVEQQIKFRQATVVKRWFLPMHFTGIVLPVKLGHQADQRLRRRVNKIISIVSVTLLER